MVVLSVISSKMAGKWIQKAIKHPGKCTPITKPGCKGPAKALALRLKPGGDLYKGKKGDKK